MRSTKIPQSRIPQSGSKSGIGSGGVGTPRAQSPRPPFSSESTNFGSSRLPSTPSSGLPKFQPSKKPEANFSTPVEAQAQPLQQNDTAPSLVDWATGTDRSGPSTPETDNPRRSASKLGPGEAAGDAAVDDCPGDATVTVTFSLDGAPTTSRSPKPATPLVTSGTPAAEATLAATQEAGPVTGTQPNQQVASADQRLPQRLESLLRGAGISPADPHGIQALAAAIVSVCTDDAKATAAAAAATAAAAAARSSRRLRLLGAAVLTACGVGAVCIAALAWCMSWLVFVLVDRGVIGPEALVNEGYFI